MTSAQLNFWIMVILVGILLKMPVTTQYTTALFVEMLMYIFVKLYIIKFVGYCYQIKLGWKWLSVLGVLFYVDFTAIKMIYIYVDRNREYC